MKTTRRFLRSRRHLWWVRVRIWRGGMHEFRHPIQYDEAGKFTDEQMASLENYAAALRGGVTWPAES